MNIIGDRLKELRTEKGLSQAEVADILGVTRVAYLQYEKGISRPVRKLRELSDFFSVSIDYILGKSDLRRPEPPKHFSTGWLSVPISGAVAAGRPIHSEATDDGYVDIPPSIAKGHTAEDFLCVLARGESMEPTILDGDRLVFLRDTELHGSRKIHAISFGEDYNYTAKFVRQDEDGNIIITALNTSAWEPMILTPTRAKERDFRIHGYLVQLIRVDF